MTQDRNLNDDIIFIDDVLEEISSHFKATFDELYAKLVEESNFKRLKRIGEEQFRNATKESSVEMEHKNTRICFAKINLLVFKVSECMEALISEKLQGDYLDVVKNKVLKAILKLDDERKKKAQEESKDAATLLLEENSLKRKREEERAILEKLTDLSKFCADSLLDIKKQAIEVPLEETETIAAENSEKNVSSDGEKLVMDDSRDDDNFSLGSVSTVHTSELSSLSDDIEFSSDEETGKTRRKMSMKAVQERLAELRAKKLDASKKDQNQVKTTKHKDTEKQETNASASVEQETLSPRVRKPNSKYIDDVILLPLKRASVEKITASSPASTHHERRGRPRKVDNLQRKRGRPRKYPI